MTHEKPFVFEAAFARLEAILEKMSRGDVPLDESLKLYEEADALITQCSKKLNEAEKKVEVLIKKRNGEIETDASGKPLTQDF
jgi:exodeoxyribonuclease VII small subunit